MACQYTTADSSSTSKRSMVNANSLPLSASWTRMNRDRAWNNSSRFASGSHPNDEDLYLAWDEMSQTIQQMQVHVQIIHVGFEHCPYRLSLGLFQVTGMQDFHLTGPTKARISSIGLKKLSDQNILWRELITWTNHPGELSGRSLDASKMSRCAWSGDRHALPCWQALRPWMSSCSSKGNLCKPLYPLIAFLILAFLFYCRHHLQPFSLSQYEARRYRSQICYIWRVPCSDGRGSIPYFNSCVRDLLLVCILGRNGLQKSWGRPSFPHRPDIRITERRGQ